MSSNLIVVCDACVLYSAVLRDLCMRLSLAELFEARWTQEIHEEWMRNLLKNRPDVTKERLLRVKDLMNSQLSNALITGYEDSIAELRLSDPGDRHVLAAAIKVNASVILTYNLSDFPTNYVAQYGVSAEHPDNFLCRLLKLYPERVMGVIREGRKKLKNPPISAIDYLGVLRQQLLPKTVAILANHLDQI